MGGREVIGAKVVVALLVDESSLSGLDAVINYIKWLDTVCLRIYNLILRSNEL